MIIAAILGMLQPVEAPSIHFMDGNRLHELCSLKAGLPSCRTYVIGVVDDFSLEMDIAQKPPCVPAGTAPTEVADAVIKYLSEFPDRRSMPAAILVRLAMVREFRCNLDRG